MVTMASSPRGMSMGVITLMLMLFPVCAMAENAQYTVSVASMKISPYLMEVKDHSTGEIMHEGYIKDLIDMVGRLIKVNFTIETLDTQFGERLINRSWTGLVGQVVNKKVELVAAPMTVTLARARVMDFSVPFQHFGGVVVLKRIPVPPTTFVEQVLFILRPLDDSIWLMTLVAYFLTSVILYVICYVNPYEWRHLFADHQATRREAESFTCLNTFWFLLSTLMWQGFTRAPRSLGARLVVSVWWMFVMVFLLTYTASLTNLLRAGARQEDVNIRVLSLKDLAAEIHGSMDVGYVLGGSTDTYLEHSQVPYLFRLGRTVKKKKTYVHSVEEGIQRVRQSYTRSKPFAFVTESALVQDLVRQEPCELYIVGDVSLSGSYSLGYRRGWDLKDRVDLALLRLQENGNIRALEHKWFSGPCQAHVLDTPGSHESLRETPFFTVSMGSFSGVMILLAAGVIAGAIVTVFEIVVFRMAEKIPDSEETSHPNEKEASKGTGKGGHPPNSPAGTQNVSAV